MLTTALLVLAGLSTASPGPTASVGAAVASVAAPAERIAFAARKCSRTDVFPGFEGRDDALVVVLNEEVLPPEFDLATLDRHEIVTIEVLCWDPASGRFDRWTRDDPFTRGIPVVWVRTRDRHVDLLDAAAAAIRAQQASLSASGAWVTELAALGLPDLGGARARLTVWEDEWTLVLATKYQSCTVGSGTPMEDDVLPSRLARIGACVTWYEPAEDALQAAWDAARPLR